MKKHSFKSYKKHNNWLPIIAFFVFLLLLALILWSCVFSAIRTWGKPITVTFICFVGLSYIICGYPQVLGVFLSILGIIKKKTVYEPYDHILKTTIINNSKKVAILYVTKDDFIKEAFDTSLIQTYKNIDVYILDDSINPESKKKLDKYLNIKNNTFKIIRRNGVGPKNKAGNTNYFLDNYGKKYDYIAIMDADTYLEKEFITNSLKYFDYFSDLGIVQSANGAITNVQNIFQEVCTPNLSKDRKFWSVDGAIMNEYMITFFTGHAAVISMNAIKSIGGHFPQVVSEDLSTSVEMHNKGYWTFYAPNILSFEELPPNFFAWKKRQLRWETGSFEFFWKYTHKINFGKYHFYEKIYHVYAWSLNWSTPLLSFIMSILSFALLYEFKGQIDSLKSLPYIPWILSLVFLVLSTTCAVTKPAMLKVNVWQTIKTMLLFGFISTSIMPSSFIKFFTLFFTKKKFSVTIKQNTKIKWYETLKYNWIDIIFWMLFFSYIIFTVVWTKVWPFILNPFLWIQFFSFISLFFTHMLSNKKFLIKTKKAN